MAENSKMPIHIQYKLFEKIKSNIFSPSNRIDILYSLKENSGVCNEMKELINEQINAYRSK